MALPARQRYRAGLRAVHLADICTARRRQAVPGDSLYPIKLGGEEVKAVLEYAFGTPADWHISQIERRLEEVQALEEAGRAPDPALAAAVKEEAEQALAAAESLPPAERAETLTAWSRQLEAQRETAGESSAVAEAVAEPLAIVESVLPTVEAEVALGPTATLPRTRPTPWRASPSLGDPLLAGDVQAHVVPRRCRRHAVSTSTPAFGMAQAPTFAPAVPPRARRPRLDPHADGRQPCSRRFPTRAPTPSPMRPSTVQPTHSTRTPAVQSSRTSTRTPSITFRLAHGNANKESTPFLVCLQRRRQERPPRRRRERH